MSDNSRTELGENFLRVMWYSVATKVVEKAIIINNLNETQAQALRNAYLKMNHYTVEIY
jgi:hypothetical protein